MEPVKRSILEAIELYMLPSLIFFAVSASVGSFYFFMTLCMIMVVVGTIFVSMGYSRSNADFVLAGRIIIVLGTLLAFFSLLSDNLVFEDKQIVDEVIEAKEMAENRPPPENSVETISSHGNTVGP